ncbi:MAG: cytochrome c family protein [Ancalomicrobiaceae bacterium]|nr:cytochrome c family protein [Ancalomicrobiaceae bacterium]
MMKQVVVAALFLLGATAGAQADGDPVAGEKVFAQCKACHNIGEGATNKIGPELNGVIGRKAGSIETFKMYGENLKKMGADGLVWDAEKLTKYLHNPREFNPGTKMSFVGLKKDEDVANVIAYLSQFDADGKKK